MLELTSQEPVTLDVGFTCATARVAADTTDGVLLATVRPDSARAESEGLVVSARGGVLRVVSVEEGAARRAAARGGLQLPTARRRERAHAERDGSTVGRASAGRLPGIDVLATSLPRLSAAQGEELDVRIAVDDQFATSPTRVKTVLSILCLVGAVGSLLWLRGERPATRRSGDRDAPRSPGCAAGWTRPSSRCCCCGPWSRR